jgi:Kef-type K+ transport system membrane component KefB
MHALATGPTLGRMKRRFFASYGVLVGLPLILLIVLVTLGQQRYAQAGPPSVVSFGPDGAGAGSFHVLTLILQIAVIMVSARIFGAGFRRIGQPQVVGEMIAGIVLGPSVFGALAPAVSGYVFPPLSLDYLNALSQIGLLLFMFMIGLELDSRLLRGSTRTAVLTSHASIVLPFVLGVSLAFVFFEYAPPSVAVGFTGFALFLGTAMSITAFPVLARIIHERQLAKTRLGSIALACAAIDDVTAWCILAVVVMIARAGAAGPSIWLTGIGSLLFAAAMIAIVRPLLRAWLDRRAAGSVMSQDLVALLLVFAFASAWTTEWLGIHALFGAFLAGAILPAHYPFVRELIRKLEDITVVFLLPLFFAFTGLRTEIGLLDSPDLWLKTVLIIAVAVVGKLGGSALAARASGMNWHEAGALGALMNTRGLMELVVLNIGLDLGVIPPTLFAMMVLMALVTTFMTTPLLNMFDGARQARAEAR